MPSQNKLVTNTKRLIGAYTGAPHGTLMIALGAMHGNEPAGVHAIHKLLHMLEAEPAKNPDFRFEGRFVGFLGNIQAFERKMRFVKRDLNREFNLDNIAQLSQKTELVYEDLELRELLDAMRSEIETYAPARLVVLDLHTTSAGGGIFSIVSEDAESLRIASSLPAPVLLGLVKGMGGTTLHYFKTENMGIPTVAVSFEAGQHDDARSIDRTIAFVVDCMRAVGCIRPEDVEHRHDEILRGYSQHLPRVVELVGVHKITPSDHFTMKPHYKNFQPVKKGEILATDRHGDIVCPEDCLILMPLYQPQGTDGFFLVKPVETADAKR